MRMTCITAEIMKKFEQLIFKFLWNGKDRIARAVMVRDISEGGLKAPDVETTHKLLRINLIKRYLSENIEHPWKHFLDHRLKPVGGKYLFQCNFETTKLQLTLPRFYCEMLEAWSYSNKQEDTSEIDIPSQIMWNNRFILQGGKSVFHPNLKRKGFKYVADLLTGDGYLSWNNLSVKNLTGNEILLLYGIITCLRGKWPNPEYWETPVTQNERYFFNHNFRPVHKITKQAIRAAIYSKAELKSTSECYYEREYNFKQQWSLTYGLPFKVAIDTKTREFQFKLLHHILYTNYELFRRGMDQTPLCSFCNMDNETLDHLFYSCRFTETFWNDFHRCFKEPLSLVIRLCLNDILFGRENSSDILNHLLLLAKRHIYAMKMRKNTPTFAVFLLRVKFNYHLEYEIAARKDKLERHCSKWIPILHVIVDN